jgi:hypothetical protein
LKAEQLKDMVLQGMKDERANNLSAVGLKN